MELKCDVLVIGAGVAGSVAALSSAKKGLSTIILEKEQALGLATPSRMDVAEDININSIIKELHLPITARSNSVRWFSPNYSLHLTSDNHDLFFKRGSAKDSFETITMHKAKKSGANLVLDAKIKKIEIKQDLVKTVSIQTNGKEVIYKPKIVISCDGNKSILLKRFEGKTGLKKGPVLLAFGFMGDGGNLEQFCTHVFFDSKNIPGGYFYSAKIGDTCFGGIVVDKSKANKAPEAYLKNLLEKNKFLKDIFKDFRPKESFSGIGHLDSLKKRTIGNVLFAGDAGRVMDPLLGYGVENSIISAYDAIEFAHIGIEEENLKRLSEYSSHLLKCIPALNGSERIRKIFNNLNNEDFDDIFSFFTKQKEELPLSKNARNGLRLFSNFI